MLRLTTAVAAAALLSGCFGAGGDKAAYIQGCVKQSDMNQKTCECVADKLEKSLDKDMFHAIALQAQGKEEDAQKIINKLPMEKQFQGAMAAAGLAMSCMTSS